MAENRLHLLQQALDAFVAFREDPAAPSAEEFLARNEALRPLLEPMVYPPAGEEEAASATSATPEPTAGTRLGDYELIRELGRGGMGTVFEAEQVSLRRRVTVKVLHEELARTPAAVERFRSEAAAAARLQHLGIVPIFEVAERHGVHFFAMEFVAGQPLNIALRQGTLPAVGSRQRCELVAVMVAELAEALDYAHGQGVIHRDVKPHNVLVTGNGSVRLLDFGLATDLSWRRGGRPDGAPTTADDREGLVGTPHYMSPERIRGEPAGPTSDVFACGVVMYELLSGVRPFDGESTTAVLESVTCADPSRVAAQLRGVPREITKICGRCLAPSPKARYRTADALAADLRSWLAGEEVTVAPRGLSRRIAQNVRRHPARTVGIVAGVGIAVMAAAMLYQHNSARAAADGALAAVRQLVRVLDDRLARQAKLEPGYKTQLESSTDLCVEQMRADSTGPEHRYRLAAALIDIAGIHRRVGDPAAGLAPLDQAIAALDDAPAIEGQAVHARALSQRARLLRSLHDSRTPTASATARAAWSALLTSDAIRHTAHHALALLAIAEARFALGTVAGLATAAASLDRAREHLELASRETTGLSDSAAVTKCELLLATGLLHQHRELFAAARTNFEQAGVVLNRKPPDQGTTELGTVGARATGDRHPKLRARQLLGLGTAAHKLRDYGLAATSFDAAQQQIAKPMAEFPGDAELGRILATIRMRRGTLLVQRRKYESAIAQLRLARTAFTELITTRVTPIVRDDMALAVCCTQLANCHLLGRPIDRDRAKALYDEALAIHTRLRQTEPGEAPHMSEAAATLSNLAAWENEYGDAAIARTHAKAAIELQSAAQARRPRLARIRIFLGIHHAQLAFAERRLGNTEATVRAARAGVGHAPTHVNTVRTCAIAALKAAATLDNSEQVDNLRGEIVGWLNGLTRGSATGVRHLLRSSHFAALRNRKDYAALLEKVSR